MLDERKTVITTTKNGDVTLELLASYKIKAGVRGKKNYRGNELSLVSPMDLALAWGDLNQPSMLQSVTYSQSGRWYYYRISNSDISVSHILNHSANTHIIPSDSTIYKTLKTIKTNHYVELEGYLVNVVLDHTTLKTSLTRNDTGSGACEIFYVTKAKVHH